MLKPLKTHIICTLLIPALLLGCTTPARVKATKATLAAAGAKVPGGQQALYAARTVEITGLEALCEANQKDFEKQVRKNTGEANLLGIGTVYISWAGLVSGIAATALTVASPANAVWIAATAGFAGGASSFSASLSQQGFSKAAIAQAMVPYLNADSNAYTSFSTALLVDYAVNNKDEATFNAEYQKQKGYVSSIKMCTDYLQSPVGILPLPVTGPAGPALAAKFSFTPAPGKANHPITFTDQSGASAAGWLWDFGDGVKEAVSTPTVSHTYTTAKDYTVSMTVLGAAGVGASSMTQKVTVGP